MQQCYCVRSMGHWPTLYWWHRYILHFKNVKIFAFPSASGCMGFEKEMWTCSLPPTPTPPVFLGPHLQHMEVPRLGVQSELQLPAYTTATATQDLSHICDLPHSSRQCRILNPLSEPGIELPSSRILLGFLTQWATVGTPAFSYLSAMNMY